MFHLNPLSLELHMDSFVADHRSSAQAFRFGPPSLALRSVAAVMGGFARVAGGVERWARSESTSQTPVANPARATVR